MKWYHWLGGLVGILALCGVSFLVGFGMPVDPAGGGRDANVWSFLSDLVKVGGGVVASAIGFFLGERSRRGERIGTKHQMAKDWSRQKDSGLWHNMSGWDLEGINLAGKNLVTAQLRGARLGKADLSQAQLGGADLTRADLRKAVMIGVWPREGKVGPSLRYADLRGADLTDAVLNGSDCFGASMSRAKLTKALLRDGVNLQSADLRRADLRGAVLTDAKLQDADLRGAKLFETDMTRANLRGAKIDKGQLDTMLEAGTLAGATLPDGTRLMETQAGESG